MNSFAVSMANIESVGFGAVITKIVLAYAVFYAFQPDYHPPCQQVDFIASGFFARLFSTYVLNAPGFPGLRQLLIYGHQTALCTGGRLDVTLAKIPGKVAASSRLLHTVALWGASLPLGDFLAPVDQYFSSGNFCTVSWHECYGHSIVCTIGNVY